MSVAATAAAPPRSIGDAKASALRQTAIVVVGCGIAGVLVGGMGSRLVMRIAALAAPEVCSTLTESGNVIGETTPHGTIALMLIACSRRYSSRSASSRPTPSRCQARSTSTGS